MWICEYMCICEFRWESKNSFSFCPVQEILVRVIWLFSYPCYFYKAMCFRPLSPWLLNSPYLSVHLQRNANKKAVPLHSTVFFRNISDIHRYSVRYALRPTSSVPSFFRFKANFSVSNSPLSHQIFCCLQLLCASRHTCCASSKLFALSLRIQLHPC